MLRFMVNVQTGIQSLVRKDEGQDLLEYALLVALIALAAVAAVTLAGKNVAAVFNTIAGKLPTGA
jgi:pilus assembly protein Flp/PilA